MGSAAGRTPSLSNAYHELANGLNATGPYVLRERPTSLPRGAEGTRFLQIGPIHAQDSLRRVTFMPTYFRTSMKTRAIGLPIACVWSVPLKKRLLLQQLNTRAFSSRPVGAQGIPPLTSATGRRKFCCTLATDLVDSNFCTVTLYRTP